MKEDSDKLVEIVMINVTWKDGYFEVFKVQELRFGTELLWMKLLDGGNRLIPLQEVRFFSISPVRYEKV